MIFDLPEEVRKGLEEARKRDYKKRNRLRLVVDDEMFHIERFWEDGFALDAETAPHVRGFVDIFDGGKHLYQCLIVCSSLEGRERIYTFKRQTAVSDTPPLDFARDPDAPVALLR